MAQKWNLQDIKPAQSARRQLAKNAPAQRPQNDIKQRVVHETVVEETFDPELSSIDIIDGNKAKRTRVFATAIITCVIVGSAFALNVLLGGAEVTVYPKYKNVSLQAEFTAHQTPKANELGYEILTLSETQEAQVKASGKESVSLRSEGKIFIYNTKGTTPQRLVKNTRFESKDGLIFKIKESVEVPAPKKDAAGNLVPGSVSADVYADGTGEQYNIPPQRFTVPGLKGSEQYESIYGESSADFAGGFEGEKYIIDEDELSTAKQQLHIDLRKKLLEKLRESKPAGFILYEPAIAFSFETLPPTQHGDSMATLKEKAYLRVPLFKEDEFASYVARHTVPDYKDEPVLLKDPYTLTFSYAEATTTVSDISIYPELTFNLTGSAKAVWQYNEEALLNALIGQKKSDTVAIFSDYPAITEAQSEIRPFWAGTFPDSISKIKLQTVIGE
jgi:hypothetical protein